MVTEEIRAIYAQSWTVVSYPDKECSSTTGPEFLIPRHKVDCGTRVSAYQAMMLVPYLTFPQ